MATRTEHFVVFLSPGTFVDETTEKPIPEWDPKAAVGMAEAVTERHGAKPYGFRFLTCLVADPIPDGRGGTLNVERKVTDRSGVHYIGGKVETYADVVARNDPKDSILRSNMRANRIPLVVVNTNSFKTVRPFEPDDRIVGPAGELVESGSNPDWEKVRAEMLARQEAEAVP